MSPQISERSFEEAIECALLAHGPDAFPGDDPRVSETPPPYGQTLPGGYLRRDPKEDDRKRCLLPHDVLDFIYATQPKAWEKLKQHHGAEVKERFLARVAGEVSRRGVLDVLRRGIKDSGCRFRLAYFRPASGLNAELQRLYEANLFAVVRQVRYSEKNENSIDLVLFLNGLPLFTAELKNPLTGQNVQDAMRQYRFDRDSKGAAACLSALSGALCGRPGPGLCHYPTGRGAHAFFAVQPGQVRRRRQSAQITH